MTLPHRFFATAAVELALTLGVVTPLLCPGLLWRCTRDAVAWAGFAACCLLLFWIIALFWLAVALATAVYGLAGALHAVAGRLKGAAGTVRGAAHRALGF